MKHSLRSLSIILVMVTSCGRKSSDEKPSPPQLSLQSETRLAPLRGVRATEDLFRYRIFKEPHNFRIFDYLDPEGEGMDPLLSLMGAYDGNGLRFDYIGRTPNDINILLWHTVFTRLAKDLESQCTQNSLRATFQKLYCKKNLIDTAGLWQLLVDSVPVASRILPRKEAFIEVTMSPYFLLEGAPDAESP